MQFDPPHSAAEAQTPEEVVRLAEEHFNFAISWMHAVLKKLNAGEPDALRDAGYSWKAVSDATHRLAAIRDDLSKLEHRHGAGPEIDFEAVRDRIGGLLDRLRAARDAREVSGEPDA
ncbi:MAG: hypothetical protein AAGA87_15775 [Pseudomonadota bacterium]